MAASNELSFEDFVRAHLRGLVAFGLALTSSEHESWDVTQEALVRLCANWSRVYEPLAYTRRTMVRVNIDNRRKLRRERLGDLPEMPTAEHHSVDVDPEILRALQHLSPSERAALSLRYLVDQDYQEIAETLGCREVTARTHVSRGRAKLRQMLQRPGQLEDEATDAYN